MSEQDESMKDNEAYDIPLKDRRIQTQASDPPISDLCDRMTKGRLDVQADFQRNYVWATKAELRSKLIEKNSEIFTKKRKVGRPKKKKITGKRGRPKN